MVNLISFYTEMPAADKLEKTLLWLTIFLSLQEEERKMYHWRMGVRFKAVNIKCKSSGSLNKVIQQGFSYWCPQLSSFFWYDQSSLIGAYSAALKHLIKRQRRTYFPAAYFPRFEGFFFPNEDRHLATNIVKNVVFLPLWALEKEWWWRIFSSSNQKKCKFLSLGAVFSKHIPIRI